MCDGSCCCCSKNAILFKLSLFGFMFALAMTVTGMLWPFKEITMRLPVAWVLAILAILPSMAVYYAVRDGFWTEVEVYCKAEKARKHHHK